jgi:hypothetical protein
MNIKGVHGGRKRLCFEKICVLWNDLLSLTKLVQDFKIIVSIPEPSDHCEQSLYVLDVYLDGCMSLSFSYSHSFVNGSMMRRRTFEKIFELGKVTNFVAFFIFKYSLVEWSEPKIGVFQFSGNIDVIFLIIHELVPYDDIFNAF